MKQSLIIKSYPGGLSLHMDSNIDFDDMLNEVASKFEESRSFFKNASVAISVEDRILSPNEEKLLIQTINEHSDLNVICLVGKNEDTNRNFIKACKKVEFQNEEYNGRFYTGNVYEDQVVECEGTLVIIGNVLPGGTVAAAKNIIVLGELCGEAYAGMNGNSSHFIYANKIGQAKCKIADKSFKAKNDKNIFAKKNKEQSVIIYLNNDEIVMDNFSLEKLAYVASI